MSQPNQPSNPFNWNPYNFGNNNNTNYSGVYNPNIILNGMTPMPFGPYGQTYAQVPWQANSQDSHQKQFSAWEFSGDEIVGLRSWNLHDGLLFPVHCGNQTPWPTGIREGEHYDWGWVLQERTFDNEANTYSELYCGGWISRPICEDFHKCVCGFYAYWDGSDDYKKAYESEIPETVTGVIRAFGKVVVGSRGFRASKARIEAIAVPPGMRLDVTYNDVPQFNSVDRMLSEFPLTKIKDGTEEK